jgi:hypothetical protein
MKQSLKHVPPVNQYKLEREFYDFIQLPENRGFNTHFAEELRHKDDSGVSRMHNPNVAEVKSWLYKAADKLDRAARVNFAVGRKALAILAAVVARHEPVGDPAAVSTSAFEALYYNFLKRRAECEDGFCSEADVAEAKDRAVEALARVGTVARPMGQAARNREADFAGA